MTLDEPDPRSDVRLVERLQADDESVLKDILRAYGPKVGGWLRRQYPWLDAYVEDILSLTIYRLWECRNKYDRRKSGLRHFFFLLARNVAADMIALPWQQARMREIQRTSYQDCDPKWNPKSEGRIVRKSFDFVQKLTDLADILANLPTTDQTIIIQHTDSGGKAPWTAELVAELDMSAAAIRMRRARILKRIRKEMANRGHQVPGED